ncbi:MAG: hypothetical protein NC218_03860 [Acetobacter sp.]|nr:hypothetical protein [Acetobacter sp.]
MEQQYNVVPLFETVVELPKNVETNVDSNILAIEQAFDQSTIYLTSVVEGNWDQVLSVNGQTGDVWVNPSVNDYTPKTYYAKHDMIAVGGRLYRAIEKIPSAPEKFDVSQWEEVDVVDNILHDFEEEYTYEKGEIITVDGKIYRAKDDFTSTQVINYDDWELISGVIIPEFEPNTNYNKNSLIRVGQSIFAADENFKSGETYNSDDWTIIATALASEEHYDNTTSQLEATTVQEALDELATKAGDFESEINQRVDSIYESLTDQIDRLESDKVDKVDGKGLSTNDFTNEYKQKLDDVESGAEVNVQADWKESDSTSDAYIKNKPAPYVLPQATATVLGGIKAPTRTTEQTRKIGIDESTGELFTEEEAANGIASIKIENAHLIITLADGTKYDSGFLPHGYIKRQTVAEMDGSTQTFTIEPAVNTDDVTYITINGVDYNSEYYTVNTAGNSITTLFPEDAIPTGKLELILTAIGGNEGSANIPRFTNEEAGSFLGSNKEGEIGSTGRGDGTGKVNGWQELKDSIADKNDAIESEIAQKQDIISEGDATQYYRGDKTWQTLDKKAVGLNKVENKSIDEIRQELTGDVTPVEDKFVTGATLYEQLDNDNLKNVRADWDESDTASYAYIRNKPQIVRLVLSTEDIGEGVDLPANTLYGVYTESTDPDSSGTDPESEPESTVESGA